MKYFSNLLFILFLLPCFSSAQTNYKPGYVVVSTGDTIKGFIDYKQWNKNPTEINFKDNLNTKNPKTFSLNNMSAFAVTGFEYYQRFILSVSKDPVDLASLGSKPDTSTATDTVFLRICTKGKNLALFSYTDALKLRYYFLEAGQTQPQELGFHAYLGEGQDGSSSVKYVRRYRTQLAYLVQKFNAAASGVNQQIQNADYTEPELVKIVQLINGSSGGGFTPQSVFGTRLFAGAGIFSNNIQFAGNIAFPATSAIAPKISGGIDLLPNKNVQRFFLRAEVTFASNNYKLSNNIDGDPTSLNIDQYNLSIVPQVVYNLYNTDQFKVFIDAGLSFNLSSYNNYSFVEYVPGDQSTVTINKYPTLEKSWVSFPFKAGVLLNRKLEIYAGYTPRANISSVLSSGNSVGSVVTVQAGVNYLFGSR